MKMKRKIMKREKKKRRDEPGKRVVFISMDRFCWLDTCSWFVSLDGFHCKPVEWAKAYIMILLSLEMVSWARNLRKFAPMGLIMHGWAVLRNTEAAKHTTHRASLYSQLPGGLFVTFPTIFYVPLQHLTQSLNNAPFYRSMAHPQYSDSMTIGNTIYRKLKQSFEIYI